MVESFILLAIVVQYAVCRKLPKYRYFAPLVCLAVCMLVLFCAVQLDPWSSDKYYIVTGIEDDSRVIFETWEEAKEYAEEIPFGHVSSISRERHWGSILFLTALPAIGMLLFALARDLLLWVFRKVRAK